MLCNSRYFIQPIERNISYEEAEPGEPCPEDGQETVLVCLEPDCVSGAQ